jgi:DNA-binding protein HU-beta
MENISKKEFVDAIASKTGLTKKDAQKALEATIESIIDFTKKGSKVSLIGFGGFYPYKTKATTKKNPKTGKPVQVPAKTVLKFKSSKNITL